VTLSKEQREAAQMSGISDEDYAKFYLAEKRAGNVK